MNVPKYPLRINVGFLLNQPIGYSRDIHFEYPEVILKPDKNLEADLKLTQFKGVARVGRTPQGIIVHGDFEGRAPAECVRCLTDFTQPLKASFDELYAFDKRSTTDSGLILPEDANIDLEPLAREYLLIEFPINTVCKTNCQGLCPICGANLNEESEGHEHPEEDPDRETNA